MYHIVSCVIITLMKLEEKFKAIELRKQGNSYSDILKVVNVSKSTISLWLRNIDLTPDQVSKLIRGRDFSRYIAAQKKKQRTIEKRNKIIQEAKVEFKKLLTNPLFLPGLSLYWAEGDKNSNERVKFTNSDEKMIKLMMRWFREVCLVPNDKFRVALHAHSLHVEKDLLNYWSKITKVPLGQFNKVYIKNTSLGQRKNILYNGTCAIVVSNKELFRKIVGWKFALLEYFNISP